MPRSIRFAVTMLAVAASAGAQSPIPSALTGLKEVILVGHFRPERPELIVDSADVMGAVALELRRVGIKVTPLSAETSIQLATTPLLSVGVMWVGSVTTVAFTNELALMENSTLKRNAVTKPVTSWQSTTRLGYAPRTSVFTPDVTAAARAQAVEFANDWLEANPAKRP